jgi:poly(rC)-binding protein 2/3/4
MVQAFGLIVRRINDEPFDVPSVPGSRAVTIKFMIPNSRMGSVIGKQGAKIKEIQDASGARLNASEGMLPGSTEVSTSVFPVSHQLMIHTSEFSVLPELRMQSILRLTILAIF